MLSAGGNTKEHHVMNNENQEIDLLPLLRQLETELHRPAARGDRHRLDALLHDDFLEFGRSGGIYTKADTLDQLPTEAASGTIRAQDFSLRPLAPGVAMLNYRSACQQPDSRLERHTLRTSIWTLTDKGWQMSFHQGTPTDPFSA
ncbi:nuclear transport factor 2 family protein [Cupriavidus basilensis]|nr:nuclear transport factor 2 family protein [Cupriavidus basilensis]